MQKSASIALLVVLFLLLIVVIFQSYYIYMLSNTIANMARIEKVSFAESQAMPTPTAFTPANSNTIHLTPTTTLNNKTDNELLSEAFGEKYNRPAAEAIVTISKNTGKYISGGIKFSGEMGGGWFLAVKENGIWKIVQDGNGTISCELVSPYDFPKDMVPECWDEENNRLIKR